MKSSGITILAIDDVAENLVVLKTMLSGLYELCVAKSVQSGLAVLNNTKIDLVLLDIEMPGENGFDFIRSMKSNVNYKNIPVIFVTGNATPEIIKQAVSVGAKAYVVKPVKKEVLLEKIKEVLPRRQPLLNKISLLRDACISGNVKQIEEALEEVKRDFSLVQKSTAASVAFESVITLVSRMDYSSAIEKLNKLLDEVKD